MKEPKVFRCEVDKYRCNGYISRAPEDRLYQRNTKGVYYVCAKTPDEARKILQKKIKFGSICVPKHQFLPECIQEKEFKYKEIYKYAY